MVQNINYTSFVCKKLDNIFWAESALYMDKNTVVKKTHLSGQNVLIQNRKFITQSFFPWI